MTEDQVRPWLLTPVYARLRSGMGDFLAELRPTVAVFLRFSGIDYDGDEAAGEKLDAFIRGVQGIVERYRGTLVDLNIGDKGSYIYMNFGAPIAHEDNAARAASAALELLALPGELPFIQPLQIGITQGRMRAGAYGGSMHRTYGVLGDAVNLAARLMMKCEPGQILVSRNAQASIADQFTWESLAPVTVKGKSEPIEIAALSGAGAHPAMHLPQSTQLTPLVGRDAEISQIEESLERALQGDGQVLSLVGEAGLGKSRLAAEVIHRAHERGFTVYGGECESYGVNTSYLVWQPIWRALFGLETEWPEARQSKALQSRVQAFDPTLARRVPLLGAVLGLSIADNDLTRSFDAKLRKSSLETLLADILAAMARDLPILLVLEDCHWLDSLSHDLLEVISRSISDLPVLILLAYRPVELERLQEERVSTLPYHSALTLEPLTADDLAEMARRRLMELTDAQAGTVSNALVRRLAQQAEGNPFYLEELVNYIGDRALDPSDPYALSQFDLPSSVQSLVLTRMDQLGERQKTLLKVASVLGRVFRVAWLLGVYPDLGQPGEIRDDLVLLSQQNLTAHDLAEPELTYFFKHIITHGVIYDSLLHMLRTALHEQIGRFIESQYAESLEQHLDLLAYHYDRSEVTDKKRTYLRRAGEAAQAAYANEAAIDYYERVLPLLPPEEQVDVMRKLGGVMQLVGRWVEAEKLFREAMTLAEVVDDRSARAYCIMASGELLRLQGSYAEALEWYERARTEFDKLDDRNGVAQAVHYAGNVATQQGELDAARDLYEGALAVRREIHDRAGEANLLNNLGIIAEYQGDYVSASASHQETLAIRRELGDRLSIANSLNNLGNILQAQGDYHAARRHLEEAVALQREIGDRWALANGLNNLANVLRAQGNHAEARLLYEESLSINRGLGDRWAIAYLLEDIARLANFEGRPEHTLKLLAAAATLREEIGAPLPPVEQTALDELRASLYETLGEERADAASAEGCALSADLAIECALETIG